ncbi:hypothetical protein [Zooshikella ganghwensis]
MAADTNNLDIAKLLLEEGADINAKTKQGATCPLGEGV